MKLVLTVMKDVVLFRGESIVVTSSKVLIGNVVYPHDYIKSVEIKELPPLNPRFIGWLMLAPAPIFLLLAVVLSSPQYSPYLFGLGGGGIAGGWLILTEKPRYSFELILKDELKHISTPQVISTDKVYIQAAFEAANRGLQNAA